MGTGYTRQSVADIVDGNTITAAPLNAEFNALQSAFDGTSGHSHDGTTGEGPKISLTTSISGILPVANGGFAAIHKINATGAPAVTDDVNAGYGPGSTWTDITNDQSYICLDATASSAVWKRITLSSSADYQPLDADLTALAALSTTGLMARTAANTYTMRTVTGTANEITVTNGSGISGNPTLSLPSALTFTGKTVTGGTFTGGTIRDDVTIVDPVDNTKATRIDAGNVTAGQTRVITAPNYNLDLSKVPNAAASQSFSASEKAQLFTNMGIAWERISDTTFSAASSVSFTDLSGYRSLRFRLIGFPTTDGVSILLRTSTNNGVSYDNGATDYSTASTSFNTGSVTSSGTGNQTAIPIVSNADNGTSGGFAVNGEILFFGYSYYCHYHGTVSWRTAAAVQTAGIYSGVREDATARDAFIIFPNGGTISGRIILEGTRV